MFTLGHCAAALTEPDALVPQPDLTAGAVAAALDPAASADDGVVAPGVGREVALLVVDQHPVAVAEAKIGRSPPHAPGPPAMVSAGAIPLLSVTHLEAPDAGSANADRLDAEIVKLSAGRLRVTSPAARPTGPPPCGPSAA